MCKNNKSATNPEECRAVAVVGLGNPAAGDDAAGLVAVKAARNALAARIPQADFLEVYSGGFDLFDAMAGYPVCLIVDSMYTRERTPGDCRLLILENRHNPPGAAFGFSHGIDLGSLLTLGEACGYNMPRKLFLLGIEAENVHTLSDSLSSNVRRAIPNAVRIIDQFLKRVVIGQENQIECDGVPKTIMNGL